MAFHNIDIYPYDLFFDQYHRPLYRRCCWCNADAIVVVKRTSDLTNHSYEDNACEACARPWREAMQKEKGDSHA